MVSFFNRKSEISFSESEKEILRDFLNREIENIKMFGPAENRYQKDIDSLKEKLS